MIRRGEEDFGFQGMGDVLMPANSFPLSNVMVCTKLPIGLRRRTAAFCVARAVAHGNLMILDNWVLRSTNVSKPPLCPAPTTVSPSQSPNGSYARQWLDARKCQFYLGIRPRPAFLPARLL